MKIVYINDELISSDGSNSHAVGLLNALKKTLNEENVRSYPEPINGSNIKVNNNVNKLKKKFKLIFAFVRIFRKKYLSIKRSKEIINDLNNQNFIPTHIIARATVFDITAIYVAKKFNAKLIYEVNTPFFYEMGVLNKEPFTKKIENWEKKIINDSDKVYVVSNICKEMIVNHYNVDKNKFFVIPNGYMKELYSESNDEKIKIRNKVRKDSNLSDKFVVTFIGSLKKWHGIRLLCDLAESMEKYKDIVFLVIGDGEEHDLVTSYVEKHSNMIFKGKLNLENMKKYLYGSDLGIMPYELNKNFYYSPLKMYDMIGAGLLFVGTAVGQISDYCYENNLSDLLIVNPNIESFCNKILELRNKSILINNLHDSWDDRALELILTIK